MDSRWRSVRRRGASWCFERAFRDGFDPVGGLGWVAGLELGANDGVHHLMSALVARFVSLEDKLGGEVGVGINEA